MRAEEDEGEKQIEFYIETFGGFAATSVQLFAGDFPQERFHTAFLKGEYRGELFWLKKFASWKELREKLRITGSDPIVFGASIYFLNGSPRRTCYGTGD